MRFELHDGLLDLDAAEVHRAEVEGLSRLQVAVLTHLARHAPKAVSNESLLTQVWGYADGTDSKTVRTTVSRLRRLIEVDPSRPKHLLTERGLGYRWSARPVRDDTLQPLALRQPSFGRDAVVADLVEALDSCSVVVVTGAPGVGKTHVAHLLVERWLGPVAWIDLGAERTRAGMLAHFAEVVGSPAGPESIASHLRDRVELLVLDEVDAVAAELAPLIDTFLDGGLARVVLTSREPVGVCGEHLFRVPPLNDESAAALFESRGGGTREEGLASTASWAGLPLAVLLSTGTGVSDSGGLSGALERSLHLLRDDEAAVLAGCAAFAGVFDLAAAEEVLGGGVGGALHRLRLASLLERRGERLWLLAPIRDALVLRGGPAFEASVQAHRRWVDQCCRRWQRGLFTTARSAALKELLSRRLELERAMERCPPVEARTACRIALVHRYGITATVGTSDFTWLQQWAGLATGNSREEVETRLLLLSSQGVASLEPVESELRELLALGQTGAHPVPEAVAMHLGRAMVLNGRFDEAKQLFLSALAQPGRPRFLARLALGLAKVARARGEPGRVHVDRAFDLLGDVVDPPLQSELAMTIGTELLDFGQITEAQQWFSQALEHVASEGEMLQIRPLSGLAEAALALGDLDLASELIGTQSELARRHAQPRAQAVSETRRVFVELQRGTLDLAATNTEVERWMQQITSVEIHAAFREYLALAALEAGDEDGVQAQLEVLEKIVLPPARALGRDYVRALVEWRHTGQVDTELAGRLWDHGRSGRALDLWALAATEGDRSALDSARRHLPTQGNPGLRGLLAWARSPEDRRAEHPDVTAARPGSVLLRLVEARASDDV